MSTQTGAVRPSDEPGRAGAVRWSGVATTLLVIWIISLTDKVSIGIFIANGTFLRDLGLVGKPAEAGALASAFLLIYGLSFLVWGFIVQRVGARRSLIWSTLAWGILEAAQAGAHTPETLYILRALMGFCEGCIWPASNALTAKWFPTEERARAISVWLNGINIGPAVGIAFTTLVVVSLGWRGAFLTTGILQVVISVPLLLWLTAETPAQHPRISAAERSYIENHLAAEARGEVPHAGPQRTVAQVLADHRYWLLVAIWAFDTVIFFTMTAWTAAYLTKVRHMPLASAGLLLSLGFVIAVAFMLLSGYISDRWMRRAPISVVGYLVAAVALWLTVRSATPILAALFLALTASFKNGASLTSQTMLHHVGPSKQMDVLSSLQQVPSNIMAAFGPALFGLLIAVSGGFTAGLYGIVGLFVLCAIMAGVLAFEGM